jgi:glyoxylase-like metal-dependent hydrolase (beta-lactamase superfamily II)
MVRSGQWCAQLGLTFKPFTGQFHDLSDGDILSFGHTSLKVIATPGHTQGGVCFLCEEAGILFSGDTLFAGSIGRTDNIGGDYDQLIDSIVRKILPLDGDINVLPGHGPATSVGYERATNPFLQPA